MTRSEREQLIERYLREEMTPAEEEAFFIEAATDRELRFDLKASRVVETAFRKDREGAPSVYSPMREHLAQMLAAGQAAEQTPTATQEPAAGTAQPPLRKPVGWIVTAASIGLLSLLSLLLGITAIDRTKEREGAPVVIEGQKEEMKPGEFASPRLTPPNATESVAGERPETPVPDRREPHNTASARPKPPVQNSGADASGVSAAKTDGTNERAPSGPLNNPGASVDTNDIDRKSQISIDPPKRQ